MRPKRAAVVVGLVGIVGLVAKCTGSGAASGAASPQAATVDGEDKELRQYLSETGPMYAWEVKIQAAVCKLEEFSSLPDADKPKWCPSGTQSITPPPHYPP